MSTTRPQLLLTFVCLLLLLAAVPGRAQYNPYEAQYGQVVEVSVDDLLQMPESYTGKSVRTRGRLEMLPSVSREAYGLRGTFGGWLQVEPVPEARFDFETNARRWMGGDVEVTGVFSQGTDQMNGQTAYYIMAWAMLGPPDEKEKRGPVTETTLEQLVTKPGKLDGKMVRVRGQFRGQNLFGDLPAASRKRGADWVLKEDLFAVWVTGRKPKGAGWAFDAGMKRDTGKWLEVTGRVSTSRGVVTIDARDLTLVKEGSKTASAEPVKPAQAPPPPPPKPKKPPVLVFSLPLDGEREVAPDTVFRLQFSKDMDEPSFKDRVVLRYAGRPQPGDRELDAVKVSYDGGLRTLNVDPGDLLRPGRIVEILLLPGIVDLDGLPLETRPGRTSGAAADVLRFQVGAGGVAGGIPR